MTKPKPIRPCKTCGTPFLKPWKRAVYCSILCQILPRVKKEDGGCWIWSGAKNNHGYGQINLNGTRVYVHRSMYEAYLGEIPEGKHLLHSCDTPSCCNPEHLTPGTAKDNLQDMAAKGRSTRALSVQQVDEIRALYGIVPVKELAKRYSVSRSTIWLWIKHNSASRSP